MKAIYVDANGTYPVAPDHYDAVSERLKVVDGNPSSIHAPGRQAKIALEEARVAFANLIGARAQDVVFTSGATEANNFVLSGATMLRQSGSKPHVIVTAAEHSAVIEPARVLAERGLCRLSIAPVTSTGQVDSEALLALIDAETALVAIIGANNETGAVNPLRELTAAIKQRNANIHVHADCVQMLGKMDLNWLGQSQVSSAAFSGHKIGAFKGIGALYLQRGTKLAPLLGGGGQERGRRAGTENMPGIVSLGLRCRDLAANWESRAQHMRQLRQRWLAELQNIPAAKIHGSNESTDGSASVLANTVNFHVEGIPGDDILLNFDLSGIYASSGSACSSSVARPSHVLLAMGYSEWVALNSVRVSFTAENDLDDIPLMGRVLREVIARHSRNESAATH
jgi:cysteine desulfurase